MKTLGLLLLLSSVTYATSNEQLIDQTEPKVVKIGIITNKGTGGCSGAFINPDGTVLTCAHCFEHDKVQKVFIKNSKGEFWKAELKAIDFKRDLALIGPTEDIAKVQYFVFGKEVKRGMSVLSFGSPLGYQHTVTIGYVTNLITQTYLFVFHSAFISPGNSGGPLVNMKGELVGVNEAMLGYGFMQMAHGLYVAISVDTIKDFLKGTDYEI